MLSWGPGPETSAGFHLVSMIPDEDILRLRYLLSLKWLGAEMIPVPTTRQPFAESSWGNLSIVAIVRLCPWIPLRPYGRGPNDMNRQTTGPLCWGLLWLAAVSGDLFAQGPVPRPKFGSWNPPAAQTAGYYGILGAVAKPGVYSAEGREVTLQELIQHAGGISPQASPAVRLVRQNRVAQGRYFDPAGHDGLLPGDMILVESLAGHTPGAAVSIGLIGVMDRPVVVPMRAETAQITTMMLALGQSQELARSVQIIVPSRQRLPSSVTAPLSNGTVLIFDPKLLVGGNLPAFPEPIPMTRAAAPQLTQTATPAPAAMPQPTLPQLPDAMPDNRLPVTTAARNHGEIEATTLPFSNGGQRPEANAASLPVPGSRLQPDPIPPKPVPQARKPTVPLVNADAEIVSGVDDLDLESDDETAIEATTPAGFSLLQMLGIGGTVASLVGVAVLTRNVIGRDSPSLRTATRDDIVPASIRKRTEMPMPQAPQMHRRFDLPEPLPGIRSRRPQPKPLSETQPIPPTASETEPHDLADLLEMRGPIETEGVVLPHGLKLRREALTATPFYRVDEAAELPGAPHERPTTPATPQRSLDDAATMKVPAPHFSTATAPAEEPAPQPAVPEMMDGKAIERALYQLLRGKLS